MAKPKPKGVSKGISKSTPKSSSSASQSFIPGMIIIENPAGSQDTDESGSTSQKNSSPPRKSSTAGTGKPGADGNFFFVGAKLSHTKKADDNSRSLFMREYYRRKRQTKSPVHECEKPRKKSVPTSPDAVIKQEIIALSSSSGHTEPGPFSDSPSSSSSSSTPSEVSPTNNGSPSTPSSMKHELKTESEPELPVTLFHDPVAQHIAFLDQESQKHFRRWIELPKYMMDMSSEDNAQATGAVAGSLMARFPVAIHWFAACSGRQLDPTSFMAMRNHNAVVKYVNHEIVHPTPENYNSLLIGISGALTSANLGCDPLEFEVHRRGRALFLRTYGPPEDPEVMVHMIQNSLVLGRLVHGLDHDSTQPTGAPLPTDADMHLQDLVIAAHNLVSSLEATVLRTRHIQTARDLADRTPPHRDLFAPGSRFHAVLRGAPFNRLAWPARAPPSFGGRRGPPEMSHHAFLIFYLSELVQDIALLPSSAKRTEAYAGLATALRDVKPGHIFASAKSVWIVLSRYKYEPDRAWRAYRSLLVLLRLSAKSHMLVLRLMMWELCLEDEAPGGSVAEVKAILTELGLGT